MYYVIKLIIVNKTKFKPNLNAEKYIYVYISLLLSVREKNIVSVVIHISTIIQNKSKISTEYYFAYVVALLPHASN